jgi:hypothetical protein
MELPVEEGVEGGAEGGAEGGGEACDPGGGTCAALDQLQRAIKVVDAFCFFKEFDLLVLRLHELRWAVDSFVLVESTVTHSNQPKPLYFAEWWRDQRGRNTELYRAFDRRIVHVVVNGTDDVTDDVTDDGTDDGTDDPSHSHAEPLNKEPLSVFANSSSHIRREEHQRNALLNGLRQLQLQPHQPPPNHGAGGVGVSTGAGVGLAADDLVFISDVDEIPRASFVRRIANYASRGRGRGNSSGRGSSGSSSTGSSSTGSAPSVAQLQYPIILTMSLYVYSFSWRSYEEWGLSAREGSRVVEAGPLLDGTYTFSGVRRQVQSINSTIVY